LSGASCSSVMTCSYGATQCNCYGGTWHCNDCPGTAPSNGTNCSAGGAVCLYGNKSCRCSGYNYQWHCQDCPGSQPSTGDDCNAYKAVCIYGSSYCSCESIPAIGLQWNCP
jgi:hypothetical protein